MARPRLPIGTHGTITSLVLPDGRVEVRTRYRDGDGKTRQVSVIARSRGFPGAGRPRSERSRSR